MAHKVAIINGKQPSGGVGGVSDADLSNLAINYLNAGITISGDYKVEQQTTPNMTVKVNTGKAYIPNSSQSMLYQAELDTAANVTIANNSSGNQRIDAAVIKIDLGVTPNNYADNVATLIAVQGTPSASPVAPTDAQIQSAAGSGNPFFRLADVIVDNGAISITNAKISDKRITASIKKRNRIISATDGSTVTFDISKGEIQNITIADNRTFAVSNVNIGDGFMLRVTEDSTGNHTITWWSTIKWDGGVAPPHDGTANKTETYLFICTGTNQYDGYKLGQNM